MSQACDEVVVDSFQVIDGGRDAMNSVQRLIGEYGSLADLDCDDNVVCSAERVPDLVVQLNKRMFLWQQIGKIGHDSNSRYLRSERHGNCRDKQQDTPGIRPGEQYDLFQYVTEAAHFDKRQVCGTAAVNSTPPPAAVN